MIQFSKLRLSGFKSFVDKTEMEIGEGLNGIVGPNGCGKSNLVEALRWVMGENSAKRMRGDGMEDVIFAGTDKRSARNFAEVSLLLDNSKRQAPSPYNNTDEIEVTRKIERDKGSSYRVNGKLVRARDVQMLFADTVTGANSPSLVSQGHVTRMINAKPHDRRLILEESAGIAGLYARRHEAELRLKAADTNLIRVEDISSSMENRLNGLKRQARQASKYKNLSAQIRQMELLITHLEWCALSQKKKEIENEFNIAESNVTKHLVTVTQLNKTYNTQFEDIPDLRKKETEISAELQKKKLEFERVNDEIKRYTQTVSETSDQQKQTENDLQTEQQNLAELEQQWQKTETEHAELIMVEHGQQERLKKYSHDKENLAQKVKALEERYNALKDDAAERKAKITALEKQLEQNRQRLMTLSSRKESIQRKKDNIKEQAEDDSSFETLNEKFDTENKRLITLKEQSQNAKQTIERAENALEKIRSDRNKSQQKLAETKSEFTTLELFFNQNNHKDFPHVLDSITTQQGYERALSRAMGDTLMASTDHDAPEQWTDCQTKENIIPIKKCQSLAAVVDAPKNLYAALSNIFVVEDNANVKNALASIKPGQALVTKNGEYWRWDGYHIKANATDRHAVYLEQKNKHNALQAIIIKMEAEHGKIEEQFETANTQKQNTQKLYDTILEKIASKESVIRQIMPQIQALKEKAIRLKTESENIERQTKEIDEDIDTIKRSMDEEQITLSALTANHQDEEISAEKINAGKIELDQTRLDYQNSLRAYDLFIQEENTRKARIQAVADERINLKNRLIRSKQQIKILSERLEKLNEKLRNLEPSKEKTATSHQDKEAMLNTIYSLEQKKIQASENLAASEKELAETSKALKESEANLSQQREKRAAAQAMLGALKEQYSAMEQNIHEKFNLPPTALHQHIAMDLVNYTPEDLPKLRIEKENINRERDLIGAVNLRAEEEMNELEKELTTLLHERNDLMQGIEELRGGINKINKEARERLLTAFEHVNAHFQKLFVQLFSGGKAHLELIDSEDPLGAGLEIFAQPPGKSLQSLSLLSGGEQTLASIALIFAMFLTNPSPICVLDEIDAPLDDANVDKVCDLLEEISERVETRFVIITHHRLSMARMDRLYGVTMSERGVSQLISVDLQQSFNFVDKQVA